MLRCTLKVCYCKLRDHAHIESLRDEIEELFYTTNTIWTIEVISGPRSNIFIKKNFLNRRKDFVLSWNKLSFVDHHSLPTFAIVWYPMVVFISFFAILNIIHVVRTFIIKLFLGDQSRFGLEMKLWFWKKRMAMQKLETCRTL